MALFVEVKAENHTHQRQRKIEKAESVKIRLNAIEKVWIRKNISDLRFEVLEKFFMQKK